MAIHVSQKIGYTIDNTSKTRALFEINKGATFAIYPKGDKEAMKQVTERIRKEEKAKIAKYAQIKTPRHLNV